MNFTLNQFLDSEQFLDVMSLLTKKYSLTSLQVSDLAEYDGYLFAHPLKIKDLPSELSEVLKLNVESREQFIKDYVFERLLVANDYFDGWPQKILQNNGFSDNEISAQMAKLENILEKEFSEEFLPEKNETVPVLQVLDKATAQKLVITGLNNHLMEIFGSKSDANTVNSFNDVVFDFIGPEEVAAKSSINEIIRILDANQTVLGANNLAVAGQSVAPTVANWLALFRGKVGMDNWLDTLAIPKFLASHEAGQLKPDEKIFLGKILEFYRRLKGYPQSLLALQEPDIGFVPFLESSPSVGRATLESKIGAPSVIPTKVGIQTETKKPIMDIKIKSEIATSPISAWAPRNDNGVSSSLLNADEKTELSSHKFSSPNSEAELIALVNAASVKNGVRFRDEIMQKRFVMVAVLFLKGLRDELETREVLVKSEAQGGLGTPNAVVEPVMKMLGDLKLAIFSPSFPRRRESTDTNGSPIKLGMTSNDELVLPKNFDIKNPLQKMLDAEAQAAATILPAPPQNKSLPQAQIPTSTDIKPKLSIITPSQELNSIKSSIPNSKFHPSADGPNSTSRAVSDITRPSPLVGGVEELGYMTLSDFHRLGASTEQRIARLMEKFALLKKESLSKYVASIRAYRSSPLFQQYVNLGAESLGQSKTLTQEIETNAQTDEFLTREEFDALADFHSTLSY